MHKHGVRACNTWPTEAHRDHGSSWTCMGTRKELRLIDYICFETALPYQVCYKEDVNTDHRAIHTSIPLAPVGAVTDHVKCFSRKKRRKESLKHWTRSSEAIAEQIRGSIDALSRESHTLGSFHYGLASLVQDTSAKTKGNSRPKRPPKSVELERAEQMVKEATTPMGSAVAARRVMRLKRGEDNRFRKITADWEALFGQQKDKQTQRIQAPRHEEQIFSLNAPVAASECIRTYYETLFNSRMWDEAQYQCWFETTGRYLSDAAKYWDKLHVPMSTVLDCWRGVKSGKAPGKDGITNEVLAYFNWETLARLRGLFEKRLNHLEGGGGRRRMVRHRHPVPAEKKLMPKTWETGDPSHSCPCCRSSTMPSSPSCMTTGSSCHLDGGFHGRQANTGAIFRGTTSF